MINQDAALSLHDLIAIERLAAWKDAGPVKESAKRALIRAEEAFFKARIKYHLYIK